MKNLIDTCEYVRVFFFRVSFVLFFLSPLINLQGLVSFELIGQPFVLCSLLLDCFSFSPFLFFLVFGFLPDCSALPTEDSD